MGQYRNIEARREYMREYVRAWKKKNISRVRKWWSDWAERNKESLKRKRRKKHEERRLLLDQIKNVRCYDCDVRYPPFVMQFDHVRRKKLFNVGDCLSRSWESILREIAKCDIVCANCHAVRTWIRNVRR